MNSIELAELLYSRGHKSVLMDKGFDLEKVLLGYSPLPVNSEELQKAADSEGFILSEKGWIQQEKACVSKFKLRGV